MSVLVLRRADTRRRHRAIVYDVLVDGQQRAQIGNDSVVQLPVTPGAHVVRLKRGWAGSKELNVNVDHGQIVRLECRPGWLAWLGPLSIIFRRDQLIFLDTVTS